MSFTGSLSSAINIETSYSNRTVIVRGVIGCILGLALLGYFVSIFYLIKLSKQRARFQRKLIRWSGEITGTRITEIIPMNGRLLVLISILFASVLDSILYFDSRILSRSN